MHPRRERRGAGFLGIRIGTRLDSKRNDVDDLRLRPHPYEFFKDFDA